MVACDTEASRRDRNRRDNIIYEYNRLVAAGCSVGRRRPLAGWTTDLHTAKTAPEFMKTEYLETSTAVVPHDYW
jgi:hypothetical protein